MSTDSDFRNRRAEQARQQWLGRFILVFSVLAGIVLAWLLFVFVPPIPVLGTVGFYVIAVLLAGALQFSLRRLLGYHPQKASLRHLRSDTQTEPVFSSDASSERDESVDTKATSS